MRFLGYNLAILTFLAGTSLYAQADSCPEIMGNAILEEAIALSRQMKVDMAEDCSVLTLVFWDENLVSRLEYDSEVKEILRGIAGTLIERGEADNLMDAGLRQIRLKVLGEEGPEGLYDLPSERIETRFRQMADALKNEIGGLFGEGAGKGETGQAGNQGDPEGDPDASRLEGVSSGTGQVGGGLSNRGLVAAPRPRESSRQTGTVVIEVCVDAGGKVVSAKFTQRGSTTANAELVNIAQNNARQWRFSKGEVDRQCGTITYNFRVR